MNAVHDTDGDKVTYPSIWKAVLAYVIVFICTVGALFSKVGIVVK